MAEPITAAPFEAGLTNQKLALLGLALEAKRQSRPLILPDLIDYRPRAAEQEARPIGDIVDLSALAAALADFGVELATGEGVALDAAPLLGLGGEALADARREGRCEDFTALCRLLAAFAPAPAIAAAATTVSRWLHDRGLETGCQMRIERDWLHWTELHRADDRIGEGERLYLDHAEILAKIATTLGETGPIYLTCNEADLPVPVETIREHARAAHGLTLIFRSDIPSMSEHQDGPLVGAALDFAVAGALPRFIGHTRSTFFGALGLVAHGRGEARAHWLYNNRGGKLRLRSDCGAFVRPWAAANL